MMRLQPWLAKVLWLLPLVSDLRAGAADSNKGPAYTFDLVITATMESRRTGKIQKMKANTEVRYTWQRVDRERTLSFDSMKLSTNLDGVETMDALLSRDKFMFKEGGDTREVAYADAPQKLKAQMEATFGSAVCKLLVDEDGKELKRTVLARKEAQSLIANGAITNAVLFHPPHPSGKKRWEVDGEFTMGNGAYAKGILTYRKRAETGAREQYEVKGTLTKDKVKGPGTLATKNVRYLVSGTNTYDTAVHEWVAGRLTADVSFEIVDGDKVMVNSKGTLVVTFKMVPPAK
jgi:hypothetical protein